MHLCRTRLDFFLAESQLTEGAFPDLLHGRRHLAFADPQTGYQGSLDCLYYAHEAAERLALTQRINITLSLLIAFSFS